MPPGDRLQRGMRLGRIAADAEARDPMTAGAGHVRDSERGVPYPPTSTVAASCRALAIQRS